MKTSKLDEARQVLGEALRSASRPAVLWSGGKDSMALLHMARRERPGIEAVFYRLPWLPAKYAYAEDVLRAWNVTAHTYLPMWSAVTHGGGRMDIVEGFSVVADWIAIMRGTEAPEAGMTCGVDFICGRDWLERPKAQGQEFPFDVVLHGHKAGDVDPCLGAAPLAVDMRQAPGCAAAYFPLRHWTDADVLHYLRANKIFPDLNRYEVQGDPPALVNKADKRLNPDYYHACTACIDRRNPAHVPCPKRAGLTVENISSRVPVWEPRMDYCNLNSQSQNAI